MKIQNLKTGRFYFLVRADEINATEANHNTICSICNEPEVYSSLFASSLGGQPYPIEKAKGFLEWAIQGWRDRTHFVFLITDEAGAVCGAADIKSNNLEGAEIGYWASKAHAGIATPAVTALLGVAQSMGFQILSAYVKKSNPRSVAVLERNGFVSTAIADLVRAETHLRFQRRL